MTRVFNFSAGPAVLPESVLRQAADEMLDWHGSRHVGDGDEPPRQGVHLHPGRGRGLLRELLGDPVELQGAVHAGRRDRRERDRADEPAARQDERRLRQHRRVVEEVDQGGAASTPRSTSPRAPRTKLHAHPAARDLEARPERRLRPHLRQRDDRRRRVPLDARHRQRAAGRRHVVATSCRGRSTSRSTA